jgi:predicted enzyme related to lactoylglutathione lyase
MPVPGVGWSAYFLDTEGNTVGLFQPDDRAT